MRDLLLRMVIRADAGQAVAGIGQARQALVGMTTALAGAAASLAGMVFPVKEAMAFESAMANVRKVVDFPTPAGFQEMTNQIMEMTRHIPMAAAGLAEIAAAGGQLGVAARDIPAFTETVAKMAVAFDMTAEQVSGQMARIANIWSLPVTDLEGLGDAINHVSNNMAAKAPQIIDAMQRISGVAKMFGLTKVQATALATAFIALGAAPDVAGTGINTLLTRLQIATKQSKEFQSALRGIGLDARGMEKAVAENANGALQQFLQTMSKFDTTSRTAILSDLFGAEYGDDISKVAGSMETVQKAFKLLGQEADFAGSMVREFGIKSETTDNQAQLMRNQISEMATRLGDRLLPAVKIGLEALTGLVRGLVDGARAAMQWMRDHEVAAAGIGAALTSVAVVWAAESGVMMTALTGLTTALRAGATASLALLATPLGAFLAGAAVVAGGLAWAISESNEQLEQQNRELEDANKLYNSTIGQIGRLKQANIALTPALVEPFFIMQKFAQSHIASYEQAGRAAKEYADKVIEASGKIAKKEGWLANLRRELADTAKREQKEILEAAVKTGEKRLEAIRHSLNEATEAERQYGAEVKRLQRELAEGEISDQNRLREIRRRGMSEEAAELDKTVQTQETTARSLLQTTEAHRLATEGQTAEAKEMAESARRTAEEAKSLAAGLRDVAAAQQAFTAAAAADKQAKTEMIGINKTLQEGAGASMKSLAETAKTTEGAIKQIKTALDELEAKRTSVQVQADIKQAEKELGVLRADLARLASEIYRVNVVVTAMNEGMAAGGAVANVTGYAGGGPVMQAGVVPGIGDGDTVPRRLPVGAYVIRKTAVQHYSNILDALLHPVRLAGGGLVNTLLTPGERVVDPGTVRRLGLGVMHSINNMRLPRENVAAMASMVRYGGGGAVAAARAPEVIRLELATPRGAVGIDTISPRDQVRAFNAALQQMVGGLP